MKNFDLVIIGAGPGGYVSAIRAAQLGLKTAIVEGKHLGGICLNWGCIPTKALLRSAEIYRNIKHAKDYGLNVKDYSYDIKNIVKRSRDVSKQLANGVGYLLKKNKVTVFNGYAKLNGKINKNNLVDIYNIENKDKKIESISAKNIILATGARARILKGLEPDGKYIWSYKEALVPNEVPKRLVVLGSGAIGIEFSSFFNELGSKVTVCEVQNKILPIEDKEISDLAHKSFIKQGINIKTNTGIKSVKKENGELTITLESKGKTEEIKADRLIVAVGIVGNVENIGLEKTKIEINNSHIIVDEFSKTKEDNIYAIGDVAGAPWLAHKAEHEGVTCVEKIAGLKDVHPLNLLKIPGCTYCHPQIASIGLTEEKAKENKLDIKVGRFPLMANGKATSLGEPEGFIKTIFDKKTGEILGAHMIGAEVTELISNFSVAQKLESTEEELMHTVFPHPTISESLHESVLDAFNKAIHI